MSSVGLRELRQEASELLRRVEAGEEITITVAGRPSARLVAAAPRRWRSWDQVADLFHGPADPDWGAGSRAYRPSGARPLGSDVRAVLDTSVVIATGIGPLPGELAISAVTLAELHFGVLIAKEQSIRAERLRRLSILQRQFDALPIEDAVVASYGQLAAAVDDAGRQPRARAMDLLVAATAHAHSARIYTRNAGDLTGADSLIDVVAV